MKLLTRILFQFNNVQFEIFSIEESRFTGLRTYGIWMSKILFYDVITPSSSQALSPTMISEPIDESFVNMDSGRGAGVAVNTSVNVVIP